MTTETRIICDTCGMFWGGFHKNCPNPVWAVQTREVSEWKTQQVMNNDTLPPDIVFNHLRRLQDG